MAAGMLLQGWTSYIGYNVLLNKKALVLGLIRGTKAGSWGKALDSGLLFSVLVHWQKSLWPLLGASSQTSTPPWAQQCWCLSYVWSQCWSCSSTPTRLLSSGRPTMTFTAAGPTAQVLSNVINTKASHGHNINYKVGRFIITPIKTNKHKIDSIQKYCCARSAPRACLFREKKKKNC